MFGGPGSVLERTVFAQPALFALEVALFRLWESWGVCPGFLVGHSVGEVAVAYVAGGLGLVDACRLVVARGRLMEGTVPGVMVAVGVGEEEVLPLLGEGVSVAAVNGPGQVVLAGEEGAVLGVVGRFGGGRRLAVDRGFHSVLMEPVVEGFRGVLEGLEFGVLSVPVVSTVSGGVAVGGDLCSVEYWVRHVREAVRFGDAVGVLAGRGVVDVVEVGPGGGLSGVVKGSGWSGLVVPCLRSGRDERVSVLSAVGEVWVRGHGVDWSGFFGGLGGRGWGAGVGV
nr:acyltransferase domain-containing protein [Frankia sp. R43]